MRIGLQALLAIAPEPPGEEALLRARAFDERALLAESEQRLAAMAGLDALAARHERIAREHRRSTLEALGVVR